MTENLELVYMLEKWWYSQKRWPTSTEISLLLEMDVDDVERDFDASHESLKRRGVNRMLKVGQNPPSSLDRLRHDVALAVSNIHDQKRLASKLKSFGITETCYRGWLQDPMFARLIQNRSDELLVEELPEISKTLTRKASNGDLRAAKLLLEMTGRIEAHKTQVNIFQDRDSSTYIVKQLVEIITMHVQDRAVLDAIARDFDRVMGVGTASNGMSLAAGSFEDTLPRTKVIEGSVIDF